MRFNLYAGWYVQSPRSNLRSAGQVDGAASPGWLGPVPSEPNVRFSRILDLPQCERCGTYSEPHVRFSPIRLSGRRSYLNEDQLTFCVRAASRLNNPHRAGTSPSPPVTRAGARQPRASRLPPRPRSSFSTWSNPWRTHMVGLTAVAPSSHLRLPGSLRSAGTTPLSSLVSGPSGSRRPPSPVGSVLWFARAHRGPSGPPPAALLRWIRAGAGTAAKLLPLAACPGESRHSGRGRDRPARDPAPGTPPCRRGLRPRRQGRRRLKWIPRASWNELAVWGCRTRAVRFPKAGPSPWPSRHLATAPLWFCRSSNAPSRPSRLTSPGDGWKLGCWIAITASSASSLQRCFVHTKRQATRWRPENWLPEDPRRTL